MAKESLNVMIEIVVFTIGFLLILGLIISFINVGEKASQESTCRASVIVREKSTINVAGGVTSIQLTPLSCDPIDYGTITGTREDIKYQISELAAKCWWMYVEGTIKDLFNAEAGGERCGICYHFRIEDELDEGNLPSTNFYDENLNTRNETTISEMELEGYILSTNYDRKLLYGGGTKQYIGDHYDFFKIKIKSPKEIKLKDIKTIPSNHMQDYTGIISKETENTINELGNKLMEKNSLLFVVIADDIQRNERQDARRLIESLNMNSEPNKYDSMLISIDVTNGHIRMHIGDELGRYIKELEIQSLLKKNFEFVNDEETLNDAINNLIKDIQIKISPKDEVMQTLGISDKSFYTYLTNDGQTNIYIEDIEINRQYVIAISSSDALYDYWRGFDPIDMSDYSALGAVAETFRAYIGKRRNTEIANSILIGKTSTINEMCPKIN